MTATIDNSGVKNILFISCTRADFGKLKPLMIEVQKSKHFECRIFVTGMHMLDRYGNTYIELEKSGFKNLFPYINQMAHTSRDMDIVLASTIQGLSHYVKEHRPDLLVVHGDRVEALAGAIVGALNNILVAHIEGGEISGTVDELIRHAVTKMAHLHFVSNKEAADRLIQMGENANCIFAIGSPDIDVMFSEKLPTLQEAKTYYDIPFDEFGVFMYHPVTTEYASLRQNIGTVIDAIDECGWNFVVIYPNNDAGSEIILERLEALEVDPRFRVLPSVRFEYFLVLLMNARAIVGNSSAGIREAPSYCVPTVNIGSRQSKRYACDSILDVLENKEAILHALNNLPKRQTPSLHFGDGRSAERFMACLQDHHLWETPCQKQFQDWIGELGTADPTKTMMPLRR